MARVIGATYKAPAREETAMVDVRPIAEADIPGFHAALDAVARDANFLRGNQAPPYDAVASFVRSNIENRNPQFVAVTQEGRVVGWCDIVRGNGAHERHLGELGMGVVAAWRGRGVGRRLLLDTVAAADAAAFLRVELSVHADNVAALSLYRNSGFAEEGRKLKARLKSPGPVDVIMMARLRPDSEWPSPS
jgi:ribosomal protein S18 acetylase RimI-like enzyme